MGNEIEQEKQYRLQIWEELKRRGGPTGVSPQLLRELRIYGGAQGIWVDKDRTKAISPSGVTVSVLHTGRHYADDFSEDGVLYHYPVTRRPAGRDLSEVEATKSAGTLGVPLFVVTGTKSKWRSVDLGWVTNWDDEARLFLIEFSESQPVTPVQVNDEQPFQPFDHGARGFRKVKARSGQQKFKFDVIKRYGPKCAFCGITVLAVLDGVHLISKADEGSDDPRNGLVLCATHHRILDAGLVAIDPTTLAICPQGAHTFASLHISHETIHHLANRPEPFAVEWLWKKTNGIQVVDNR